MSGYFKTFKENDGDRCKNNINKLTYFYTYDYFAIKKNVKSLGLRSEELQNISPILVLLEFGWKVNGREWGRTPINRYDTSSKL